MKPFPKLDLHFYFFDVYVVLCSCCGWIIDITSPKLDYSIHIEWSSTTKGIGIATPLKVWQNYNGYYSTVTKQDYLDLYNV